MRTLFNALYRACIENPWSPDHKQIAGLLLEADRLVLDEELSIKLNEEVDRSPWGVESNLDLIRWPNRPLWIEWPLAAAILKKVSSGYATGVLVCPHPDFEDVVMFMSGWRADAESDANHSYAVAFIDRRDLADVARKARGMRANRAPTQSLQRLLNAIGVTISNDMQDELLLKFKNDDAVIGEALKSATGELPFALAALILLSVDGVLDAKSETLEDEGEAVRQKRLFRSRAEPPKRSWIEKFIMRQPEYGLRRRWSSTGPAIAWASEPVQSDSELSALHTHDIGGEVISD